MCTLGIIISTNLFTNFRNARCLRHCAWKVCGSPFLLTPRRLPTRGHYFTLWWFLLVNRDIKDGSAQDQRPQTRRAIVEPLETHGRVDFRHYFFLFVEKFLRLLRFSVKGPAKRFLLNISVVPQHKITISSNFQVQIAFECRVMARKRKQDF